MKNKKKIYSIFLASLGTVAVTTVPALSITSCSSGAEEPYPTPTGPLAEPVEPIEINKPVEVIPPVEPTTPQQLPPVQAQTEDERLTTSQPLTRPADMPSTVLTNYLLSETITMTDAAQVAYTSSVIKDGVNKKFGEDIGANLINVTMVPDGNYTPIRYFIKLQFDKKPNSLAGFKPDKSRSPYTLISTTYYPSKVVSQNVSQHQYQGYSQQDVFYRKEVRTHNRTINKNVYDTELNQKYKKDGFLYPGYNCDYTLDAEHGNKNVPNGYLTVNGTQIDMIDLVLKEVPAELDNKGNPYPGGYADTNFIKNEINNKRLKKHPAADNFYSQNVLPSTKATDVEFTMSTAPLGFETLGLYAPAGEIINLQFSKDQLDKFKASDAALEIMINDNYWDSKNRFNGSHNLETGRVSNHYPRVKTKFVLDSSTWSEMTDSNNYTFSFGTPFGGNISIKFTKPILNDKNSLSFGDPITFTINNAVKSLSYFDGFTTEDDWNKQIKEVKNGTITSPSISILSSLYSANIPFTDPKNHQCSSLNIDQFLYPKDCAKEWNDFLLLSNNFGGRYQGTSRLQMLDMQFNNGLWDGASAIGGGMDFYCPIDWGASSFLNGAGSVNFSNWGTIHEVNHNFEVNNAWFASQTHPETNTVNLYDLSIISNEGRYRSEVSINDSFFEPDWYKNPDSTGWIHLSSAFNTVRSLRQRIEDGSSSINEWNWYAALLYTVGSYNFGEFTRYNEHNYSNKTPGWNPIDFIKFLSDYFKTNMWNLCKIIPSWTGTNGQRAWPTEAQLTPEQNTIINDLEKYPAIDFVANLYACGQYMYNMDTEQFDYTSDITAPFEIPALKKYNFNFEKYIVCDNKDFAWDRLEFTPTSKCGGKLELDPTNNKHLIYTPNPDALNQVDEFNVKIIPTDDSISKLPHNYVPGYAWKIKVRQVINRPVIQSYLPVDWQDNPSYDGFFDVLFDSMGLNGEKPLDKNNTIPVTEYSLNPVQDMTGEKPYLALTLGKTTFCKYEFNYVVPEDGTYHMWTRYEDGERVLIDDKQVFEYKSKNAWDQKVTRDYTVCPTTFNWKKGEVHNIKIGAVNRTPVNWEYEKGYIDIQFTNSSTSVERTVKINNKEYKVAYPGGKAYAMTEQTLVPWINDKTTSSELIQNYLHSKEYQYKKREIDYRKYESPARKMTSDYGNYIDDSLYDFINPDDPNDTSYKKLKTGPSDYLEKWGTTGNVPNSSERYQLRKVQADFKSPQSIDAIYIALCENWAKQQWYPSYYQARIYQKDGTVTETKIFSNPTISNYYLSLGKLYHDVTKIEIDLYRVFSAQDAMTIGQIRFCNGFDLYNAISMNDPSFKLNGDLYYEPNNPTINYSNINGMYLKSVSTNDTIEFTLKDTEVFKILGRKNEGDGSFDVYINDKKIDNYSCQSDTLQIDVPIFTYVNSSNESVLKVKIVNTSDKPIYFNSLLTYGNKTKLY